MKEEKVQRPLCSIGSVVHVGDWSGVVIKIGRAGVMIKLDNGRMMPVDRRVIEEAVGK